MAARVSTALAVCNRSRVSLSERCGVKVIEIRCGVHVGFCCSVSQAREVRVRQALGSETDRPTLILDVGSLMGSLVGSTETNIRQALKIIDAMEPCICFIDEVEKALSGVSSSGDSGVSARLFGTFLTWLNDHQSDVFTICTCNDISKLPPEFSRAERFDGCFFLDLPSKEQRQRIWDIYLRLFDLDADQARPNDQQWTGAEIRACCRLGSIAGRAVDCGCPECRARGCHCRGAVERLRNWASGRCLDAESSGVYQGSGLVKPGRKVRRADPSNN